MRTPTLTYNLELTNHLGNVLSVVTDHLLEVQSTSTSGVTDYFQADLVSSSDYYPFGMTMPGRGKSGPADGYRYGFNGQEKETDITGTESHYSAEYWMYDSRLGRRWNVDPKPNPSISSYAVFANSPISYCDVLGDTITKSVTKGGGEDGRDLVTITISGKMINFSDKDIDMNKAIAKVKEYFETMYSSKDIDGVDYKFVFDFAVAETMEDVSEKDHLLVFAESITGTLLSEGKWRTTSGDGVAIERGKVAYVDAGYFEGIWDMNFGSMGQYAVSHEIGHLFGLEHLPKKPLNLMHNDPPNGPFSMQYMTLIRDWQVKKIVENLPYLNGGRTIGFDGLPSQREVVPRDPDDTMIWNIELTKKNKRKKK